MFAEVDWLENLVVGDVRKVRGVYSWNQLWKWQIHFSRSVSDKNSLEMRKQRMHMQNNYCHHLGCFSSSKTCCTNLFQKQTCLFVCFSNPGQTLLKTLQQICAVTCPINLALSHACFTKPSLNHLQLSHLNTTQHSPAHTFLCFN